MHADTSTPSSTGFRALLSRRYLRLDSFAVNLFLVALLAGSFAWTPPAAAQETDTTIVPLPEVQVEAVRDTETEASAPFTVSVLRRDDQELNYEAPVTIESMLREVPGVWMNDRGHFALGERLIVRGMGWHSPFGVRGVQVLLDGIPLTMPDGQAVLDIADPLFVRRAEVVRGPSSLFWGNAGGGTLFLSTGADDDDPRLRLRAGGGSHGLQQLSAEATTQVGDNTWHAAISDIRRDGFREHSSGRFTRALLHGAVDLGARTDLNLMGAFADQESLNPGSLTLEEVQEDPSQADGFFQANNASKYSTHAQLGARLTHETSAAAYSATAYGGYRDLTNPLPWAYVAFDRYYGGVRTTAQGNLGTLEWNAGIDAAIQRDDRINRENDEGEPTGPLQLDQLETVRNAAAFGYLRIPLTERLEMTAGARADATDFTLEDRLQVDGVDESGSRTFSAVSPGVGLAYRVGSFLTFANYNAAFETPTTTELVNQEDRAGGFNPDLEPQRTRGLEAGVRGGVPAANLELDAAIYRLQVTDRLVQFTRDDGRNYFRNLGENTHTGVELSAAWIPAAWLTLQSSFTGTHMVFQEAELEDNRVPGVPPQRWATSASVSWMDIWTRLSVDTVSDYYADNENTALVEGYTVLDLRAGLEAFRFGTARVQPYLEIGNIFDHQYSGSISVNADDNYFEPAPGRTFKAGLTLTL